MKMRTIMADSISQAMEIVRTQLGEDAIIVATEPTGDGDGVRVTAASEAADGDNEIRTMLFEEDPSLMLGALRDAMDYHGVPIGIAERILSTAFHMDAINPGIVLAATLDALYRFDPLPETTSKKPFLLIGPPGCGKTMTVAKLAARAKLKGRDVAVMSADTVRAGGMEQLAAFTGILEIELKRVRGAEKLADYASTAHSRDIVLVDTPGVNPFNVHDLAMLTELVQAAPCEPVLVMAAGGDAIEAAEIAEAFSALAPVRLVATRLDMTRRLGAVIAAAHAGRLRFADVAISPHVASGLAPLNPISLARLLMPEPEAHKHITEHAIAEARP